MAIDHLFEPISADAPCGADTDFSPEVDAINKARQSDDPTLEQGPWVTTLKEADWKFVATRCEQLLEKTSKDLRLSVWLAEARAKTLGFRGLADGLRLTAGLCERFWEQVYPLPDEYAFEQRIGNLSWIAARVPPLAMEIPITEGTNTAFSLRQIEAAHARAAEDGPDVDAARKRSSRGFYQALLADLADCLEALTQLERVVDDKLGADGPGFSAARSALQNVQHSVEVAAREVGALVEPQAALVEGVPAPSAPAAPGVPAGAAQSRAQALAQLRAVADFFRRTEPHSPVAYLADKAAAWGEQPLHVWLRTVIKDPAMCGQLDELLGVDSAP